MAKVELYGGPDDGVMITIPDEWMPNPPTIAEHNGKPNVVYRFRGAVRAASGVPVYEYASPGEDDHDD